MNEISPIYLEDKVLYAMFIFIVDYIRKHAQIFNVDDSSKESESIVEMFSVLKRRMKRNPKKYAFVGVYNATIWNAIYHDAFEYAFNKTSNINFKTWDTFIEDEIVKNLGF